MNPFDCDKRYEETMQTTPQSLNEQLTLRSQGFALDRDPQSFGELRRSADLAGDSAALRQRLAEDGYLYLPGYLDRAAVAEGRAEILRRLKILGALHPTAPMLDGVAHSEYRSTIQPALTRDNPPLDRVLYTGKLLALYEGLLGGPIRHFDYTWLRALAPGLGTTPHCDIVYMGRGTPRLFTAWVPFGDITLDVGGLMVLEGSHRQQARLKRYLTRDVDEYCSNQPRGAEVAAGQRLWEFDGALSKNPVSLRQKLGGRWLTSSKFSLGDVVTFGMATVHGSLDNQSDRIRLSTDSRYQLATEPADERWIGPNPIGHSRAGKRGRVC